MKILRLVFVMIVGVALNACDENPVADDRDTPIRMNVNPVFISVAVNAEKKLNGYPVNKYGEATFDPVTVTACDAKVTVREDTTRLPVEPPTKVFAKGVTAGTSCVVFTSGKLSDTVAVRVQ